MEIRPLVPLGSGKLMPALVAGFRADTPASLDADFPPWFFEVQQQAGGYAMSYPTLFGAVMNLDANRSMAIADPASLIECFRAMAEDPDVQLLAERWPKIRPLCGTWGEEYSRAELDVLDAFVSRFFDLPGPVRGLESLLELNQSAGVKAALGWRMVVPVEGGRGVGEDFGRPDDTWRDGPSFDLTAEAVLRDLGRRVLKLDAEPSLFLIWENSD